MIQGVALLSWHSGKAIKNLALHTRPFTTHCPVFTRSSTRVTRHPLLSSGVGCSLKFDVKFERVNMGDYAFCADYDKRGMAKCKGCKEKCEKESLRLGKITANPFKTGETMKVWYHPKCLFDSFKKARATTKRIESLEDDIENWEAVTKQDRSPLRSMLEEVQDFWQKKLGDTAKKTTPKKKIPPPASTVASPSQPSTSQSSTNHSDPPTDRNHKDNSFKQFRRLCLALENEPSSLNKTKLVSDFFTQGTDGDGFKGDLRLWVKLLLPGVVKRVYNLRSKQLVKLYSQIFNTNLEEMTEDLEQGNLAETIGKFFESSRQLPPIKKSILSIHNVDDVLEELNGKTREEDQSITLTAIAKKCTANDLRTVIKLIKGDLAIGAGAKPILDGVHKEAYESFQMTCNIDSVLNTVISGDETVSLSPELFTPFLPMLAAPCNSVERAFKKCPSGAMFAEVKYDGERVQLHKKGQEYKFFSRSLKPVMPHKVKDFMELVPEVFKGADSLILDAEVLMICTKTGDILPFGTLGKNKQQEEGYKYAQPCLFVFDCLHYNGQDLMKMPIIKRREILEKVMTPIKHRIMLSHLEKIDEPAHLKNTIKKVFLLRLEGLMIKDMQSIYEPGKRHWLKIKKDYLNNGAMADTADLVVLGAWYGTGKKGGKMSVFLMGCLNQRTRKWCTVTKVHTGHDDVTLDRLQTELEMLKISQDATRVPQWLSVQKNMIPDFVAADPKRSPVWEITGAEFTQNKIHTADGISIRFPRVTRERHDKDWKTATSLLELQSLYKESKNSINLEGITGTASSEEMEEVEETVPSTSATSMSSSLPSSSSSSSVNMEGSSKRQKRKKDDAKENYHKKRKIEVIGKHRNMKPHKIGPPTIFTGMVVRFSDILPRRKSILLQRYVCAYGGDVQQNFGGETPTHFIVPNKDPEQYDGPGVRVKVDWLVDCIKGKTLISTHKYQL